MEYIRRIVDYELNIRKEAFNAINIIGPKGCGKTRTAKERCNTIIEFQDEEKRDGYLAVAETSPKLFLNNPKPILFDRIIKQKSRYSTHWYRTNYRTYNVPYDTMGNWRIKWNNFNIKDSRR